MNSPTISVLIPLYNAEKFIAQAIESVFDQTFTDFEIIIVDNCSTDASFEIAKRYSTDTRVKLFQNSQNVGMIRNWNQCILYGKGKYLKFLFADDYFEKNALQEFLQPFEADPSLSMVVAPGKYIYDDGTITKYQPNILGFKKGEDVISEGMGMSVNTDQIGEPSFVMFRAKDLNIGLFNTDLYWTADVDFWFRLCLMGNVFILNGYCVFFRRHHQQATTAILENKTFLEEERNYVFYSYFIRKAGGINNYKGYYNTVRNKIRHHIYRTNYSDQKNYVKIWPVFKPLTLRLYLFAHNIYRTLKKKKKQLFN